MSSVSGDVASGRAVAAVLFDMDGLLVDTEHTWLEAERLVMEDLGGVWTVEDQQQWVGGPISGMAAAMSEVSGGAVPAETIVVRLVDTVADLLQHGADHRPGAEALLDALVDAGVPCALVSASPRVLVDAVLASVGGGHFTTTVAGDEVRHTKPFPDPYLLAAERLGVEPARCVVLEDSPTGVAAGEAAGMVVVAVPFVVPIEGTETRTVVASLEVLTPDFLDRLVSANLRR